MWIILSLMTALSETAKDIFSKKGLKNMDEYITTWALATFALPFLIPFLFFIAIPKVDLQFWSALIAGGALDTISYVLYMKAIKISSLSLAIPMMAFSPLFFLITSPLIVKEFLDFGGYAGILLIVFGAYLLNIEKGKVGLLGPFKALIKERGAILMLLAAFIASVTSNIDKIGVLHSNPIFWSVAVNVFSFGVLSIILLLQRKSFKTQIFPKIKILLPIGLFSALAFIFQMVAIKTALVAYVISIKRTSIIFSSIYGFLFLREKFSKIRLTGILMMVLGVFFITAF